MNFKVVDKLEKDNRSMRDALSATKGADLTELNRLTDSASLPAEPKSRREVRI